MHFVHIIEINDPHNPLIGALTRAELWRGLVRRAEQPKEFLPQLQNCSIVMRGDKTLVREMDFGSHIVRDRVRMEYEQKITFDASVRGRLVIAIEQPSAARLQLRFTYDVERERSIDEAAEQQYDRLVESAYVQADIDSVRIIRAMLAAGAL